MTSSWTCDLLQFSKQMESIKYSPEEGPTLFQVCEIALLAAPVAHTHTSWYLFTWCSSNRTDNVMRSSRTHIQREFETHTPLTSTSTLHNHTGTYPTCKSLHIHSYQSELYVWSSAFLSKTTDCAYVQTDYISVWNQWRRPLPVTPNHWPSKPVGQCDSN